MTKARAPFGVRDFVSFIHDWGHPEWIVLAVEAPIEAARARYAKLRSAREEFRDVPIRSRKAKGPEIASVAAIVKPADSSWSVIYKVLCLPIEQQDVTEAVDDARELSSKLKTRAAVFIGEHTSYMMGLTIYRNGKMVEEEEWAQTQSADKAFERFGLYLPACHPCRGEGKAWLAATPPWIA
jgi:hypothetical protein